jgi:ATP-dependent protease ClpP protease subunit
MSRLNLRGVIVPSEYDAKWAESYIERGIIIPESRFRSMLSEAEKGEPLTVYVNSPGGSVFSANEMVNAVREWKAETKQPVSVVLGALTASAASAFSIMVADEIKAHANAKMMFHGAWTLSLGGKELHQDTADLLEKINADIKTRLVSKYGMQPELISEWFSEGREGWLSAQDLKDAGLANEIISDPSDVIEFPSDAIKEIDSRGIGIAAFLGGQDGEKEEEVPSDAGGESDADNAGGAGDKGGEPGAGADDEPPADDAAPGGGTASTEKEQSIALLDKLLQLETEKRSLQSDRDKARAEIVALKERLAISKATHAIEVRNLENAHRAQMDSLKKDNELSMEIVNKKISKVQAKCERLVSGGMAFSPDGADKARRTASDVDPRNRLHPGLR